jgi:nitrile hydratase accessory protein
VSAGPYSDVTDLPGLSGDGDEPVFANPWQAQIFALVVGLHQRGCFSWGEWTETLSTEIAAVRDKEESNSDDSRQEEADPGDSYYRLWVTVLERILANKTIVYSDDVQNRVNEWRNAYLNTPHGNLVTLSRADD